MFESLFNNQLFLRTLTLSGQGQVTGIPDTAVIRLGVVLTGADLAAVQSQNAMMTQSVLDALGLIGVTDIKTFQYTIEKYFEYVNGSPIDKGYTVRNILEIRTTDMNLPGTIIDTSVSAGVNVVDLVSFEVSDPAGNYRQALNLAIADAIEKAASISESLGIRIDSIPVKITETSFMPRPPQPFQRELAATPIVPGSIPIEASVSAEFLY